MKKQALRQFLTESVTSANPRDVIRNNNWTSANKRKR